MLALKRVAQSAGACRWGSRGRAQPSPRKPYEEDERQRCLTNRLLASHVYGANMCRQIRSTTTKEEGCEYGEWDTGYAATEEG
ncbi:hypothetical protein CIK75_02145 [Glutamicibacter sp. BW78]|nr:hypothetical protein CIK75_02145 [Glutamicibacter sp. BW78]